jgi:hypothetical protein
MCAQDEACDLMVTDRMRLIGGMCFNGSCQMMDEYGSGSGSSGANMFLTWHIFGDPSLMIRNKTPQAMLVQHSGVIAIGESSYAVTVAGLPGARCTLYGDGVLYGSALTNLMGQAVIQMDPVPTEPATLTLTVTSYNKTPYIGDVQVVPASGAYLIYQGHEVDDTTGGDGDGQCDAGEAVGLSITLRNVGQEAATGVSAILSTSDPYVTIQVAEQGFPDIPAGQSGTSVGNYDVTFAPFIPDNHVVDFSLDMISDQDEWSRTFSVPVGRPDLAYASHLVDDSGPGGNGSGWIGPGETVHVLLSLSNAGHANARNVVAALRPDSNIVILYGSGTCPDIPAGGQAQLTPMVIGLADGCPIPSVLHLTADVTADFGYTGTVEIDLSVGGFLDDCEANRGWTCGVPGDNATSGLWSLADPVGTVYNGNVVQPEDDHTPDPGVQCYVTGNGAVGGAAGDQDVDGGKTTLLSPVFDLHAVAGATVSYWVWYTNDLGNNPGQDYWTVQVTGDGNNWVDLEHTTNSTDAWVQRSFVLQNYLTLTNHVQLRFIADDESPNSLLEALVDDFMLVVDEPTISVPSREAPSAFSLERITPNPAAAAPAIRFSVPGATAVTLRVYDVSGRAVRTLLNGTVAAGGHSLVWDGRAGNGHRLGAGMYFVRMQAPEFTKVRSVLLVE